jgi:hypothetical protein
MKKYLNGLGIWMMIILMFSLFGCSEPSENGQNDPGEPDTFVELEDIKTHSIPVEQGMTELLDMEEGMVVSRYQGTFAFGNVIGHDIEFKKLGENNYSITYTAIDKGDNLETYPTDGNAENVFYHMMVENLQEVLNTAYKLEVTEEDSGRIFKYYYDIVEIEGGDLFNFVGMEAYSLYFLDAKGRFTGMERHSFYEIYDGEEHHDFIKKRILESTD